MKSIFPGRTEFALFVLMALVAGALVSLVGQRDTMLFVMTGPIFLIAALMGFRRSLAVQPVDKAKNPETGSPGEN